jgi:hypothetical protein
LRPDKTNPFNPSGTSWNENALAYLQIVERVVARNEIDPIYQTSNLVEGPPEGLRRNEGLL